MPRARRSPAMSAILMLLVIGAGYFAWMHKDKFRMERKEEKVDEVLMRRLERAVDTVGGRDAAFVTTKTFSYRKNEGRFRVAIEVEGASPAEARRLCERIANKVKDESGRPTSVFAYDGGGTEVAKIVL